MNIVIFGPQGSGKRVQAKKLAEKYNLEHIETGQIFREIALENTQLGKKIHELMNEKKDMIPDADTIEVIKCYLDNQILRHNTDPYRQFQFPVSVRSYKVVSLDAHR